MNNREQKKEFGAYYTNPDIAQFLVNWGIRSQEDVILDPACGHGIFLEAAIKKLGKSNQIYGIEIDRKTHEEIVTKFSKYIPGDNLLLSDFFDITGVQTNYGLSEPHLPSIDVVVGNPPFIRYQRWKGETRKRAQERAESMGVSLNGLSSSWAPFVVYATAFLKKGGRLAMVLPAEVMHATYAQPVVKHLCERFKEVSLITFRKKLFSNLSEDTVLVLCDQMGYSSSLFQIVDLENADALKTSLPNGISIDPSEIQSGSVRFIEYLLPEKTRKLYHDLKRHEQVITI